MQKLLLFDLDGTLLTTDKRITARSREAIRRAQDAGYIYGVCTSRAAAVANVFVEDFMPDIMIASGGAVIIDRGRSVYENSFTADQTNYVLNVCRDIAGEDTKLTIDTAFGHYSNFPFTHPVFSNWPDMYSDLSRWDDDTCLKVCVEITDEDKVAIRDYLENKSPDHSVTISVNTKGSTGVVNVVYHNDTTDHCYTYVVTDIYGNYLDRGVKKNMPSNAYWCHFLDRLVDKISQ